MKELKIGPMWLWLCLVPFPTAMLGDHPTDQIPILLYAVNQLLAALTFFAFRSYAPSKRLFVDNAAARAMGPRRSIPAIALFVVSILFAFVNVYLSLACFLIVPLLYFAPTMMQKQAKTKQKNKSSKQERKEVIEYARNTHVRHRRLSCRKRA